MAFGFTKNNVLELGPRNMVANATIMKSRGGSRNCCEEEGAHHMNLHLLIQALTLQSREEFNPQEPGSRPLSKGCVGFRGGCLQGALLQVTCKLCVG